MSFFKYLPPDRIDVIADGRIRFTQFSDLNDPFEAAPSFSPPSKEVLNQEFDKLLANDPGFKAAQANPNQHADFFAGLESRRSEFIERGSQPAAYAASSMKFQKHLSESHGILSLSRVNHSMLMWSRYCDAHKGFVVEFDDRHEYFRNVSNVSYRSERPTLMFRGPEEQFHLAATTKCLDWAYEEEARLFQKDLGLCDYKISRAGKPDVCLFRFPPDSVLSIVAGWKIESETFAALRAALAAPHYRHVHINRAEPHPIRFQMLIVPHIGR